MATAVQSFPQSSSTITMLQTRPASATGHFQQGMTSQQRQVQQGRNIYNGGNHSTTYRTNVTPAVAPYAFTSTPALANGPNPLRQQPATPHLRQENRTLSAPAYASSNASSNQSRSRQSGSPLLAPIDNGLQRPLSIVDFNNLDNKASKPSPDRYRRGQRASTINSTISAVPSGSGMATIGHLYNHPTQAMSSPAFLSNGQQKLTTKDDMSLSRSSHSEPVKMHARSQSGFAVPVTYQTLDPSAAHNQSIAIPRTYASVTSGSYTSPAPISRSIQIGPRPGSSHGRKVSDESIVSAHASASKSASAKRDTAPSQSLANPTLAQPASTGYNDAKAVVIPPRGSSDANKRLTSPSPLSKPMAVGNSAPQQPAESPAAQHLAALNKKDGEKKGKSSRLRRAFSFGSAAELRKASAENSHNNAVAERAKLRKERNDTEEDARQAAIVEKQEAAGLGEGIYSGQGNFFTGSTDNLSISSTASSASIMLRKMGKGMKKSGRSLVGLFRPKSVIGVPAADGPVQASTPQVSLVNVEAEREHANINADPQDQAEGGTGFPKLDRNSLDTAGSGEPALSFSDRSSDNARPSRRSIVGGDKERAEVLAAVKKGILKRSGTDSGNSSPPVRPADTKTTEFVLPELPRFRDSPRSSSPSTPTDGDASRGHRRTDSVTIEGEDYFLSMGRFGVSESKSLPGTPVGGRNITFSPRIQFHDTWPPGEYDRRGEIATCNRLTPMLAQQIKEELNSFKMEMEVHESSKVYTHFF